MFKPGDRVVRKPQYIDRGAWRYKGRVVTVKSVYSDILRFEEVGSVGVATRFELADKKQFNNLIDMYYDLRRD